MLTSLAIVFVLIFNGQVGFLTNQFVWGKLLCQREDIIYIYEADVKKTYHEFKLPKGNNWDCMISVWGDGYIYPSQWDMVSKEIQYPQN